MFFCETLRSQSHRGDTVHEHSYQWSVKKYDEQKSKVKEEVKFKYRILSCGLGNDCNT